MFSDHYTSLARDFFHISHRFQALLMDSKDQPTGSLEASALRALLRQQLPPSFQVSRGYLCHPDNRSPFLEVIIHNRDGHVWYQEGDLVCLPPEQVRAVLWCVPKEADFSFIVRRSRDMAQVHNWLLTEDLPHPPFLGMWVGEQSQMDFEDGLCETFGRLKHEADSHLEVAISWGNWHWMEALQGRIQRVYKQKTAQNEPEIGPMAAWLNCLAHHLMGDQAAKSSVDWFEQMGWSRMPLVEQVASELNLQAEPVPIRVRPPHQAGREADIWAPIVPQVEKERQTFHHGTPGSSQEATATLAQSVVSSPTPLRKKTPRKISPKRRKPSTKHEATPLHLAVLAVDVAAVKRCLEEGLHPDDQNPDGDTALHLAAKHDLLEIGRLLVEAGADVNARNFVYATPLHMAVTQLDSKLLPMLLQEGAEVEVRNNRGRTPLHEASALGNLPAVESLLDSFADIHALMEKEMQPLHLAAWYGQNEIVAHLIERGADRDAVNADGNSALHFAAFNGQVKAIKVLMNLQADPSRLNHLGETYLQGLNEGYKGEMIRVLE